MKISGAIQRILSHRRQNLHQIIPAVNTLDIADGLREFCLGIASCQLRFQNHRYDILSDPCGKVQSFIVFVRKFMLGKLFRSLYLQYRQDKSFAVPIFIKY